MAAREAVLGKRRAEGWSLCQALGTLRQTANTLRRIAELTEGLPDEGSKDLVLQDRQELAADVLDASSSERPITIALRPPLK